MRIGELAKRSGVNVQTLRFYERCGVLPEPPRRLSGYRDYPTEAVRWVRFIRRAKELGFSLREIKELLSLQRPVWAKCADVAAVVEEKLQQVEQKLRDLQAIRRVLQRLLQQCPRQLPVNSCPILEAIAGSESAQAEQIPTQAGTSPRRP